MKIKDFFYSKEEFEVLETDKGILKTQNIPLNLSDYYNNENYISHINNNKSIKDKLYFLIQNWNLEYKFNLINKHVNGYSLCDYGCGNGIFLDFMKNKKGFNIQGFEPTSFGKSETEKRLNIKILNSIDDIEKIDCITLWHVLEHIPNPDEVLEKLKSKLNPNGKIIIAIPNYTSFDAEYYKEFWAAWDVPRHLFHYSRSGAINYFDKNFKIEATYPLFFDSFYISLLSENYKKQSFFNLLKAFYIGLKSNLKAKKTGEYSSLIYILTA